MKHAGERLEALLALMARLRDPVRGCPWDRQQTHASIAPHTIEEAYEVADAVARGDPSRLQDELGDLLFQVVFQAQIAAEQGGFDFADVTRSIYDKLWRRHPHVFDESAVATEAELGAAWERHKNEERRQRGLEGVLAGVAPALPALSRAGKLGKRAAAIGFDWPDVRGVRLKVSEELAELDAAISSDNLAVIQDELGDLLFSVANLARRLGVDPEESLRLGNAKFERRFQIMERLAGERGLTLDKLTLAQWEGLWNEAKRKLQAASGG